MESNGDKLADKLFLSMREKSQTSNDPTGGNLSPKTDEVKRTSAATPSLAGINHDDTTSKGTTVNPEAFAMEFGGV